MSTFVTSDAGVRIPGMIYGTAWKTADTERLVTIAIRLGFRGIDTACQPKHYNEAGVGARCSSTRKWPTRCEPATPPIPTLGTGRTAEQ